VGSGLIIGLEGQQDRKAADLEGQQDRKSSSAGRAAGQEK